MPRIRYKSYRLLLDEGFPLKNFFPRLNSRFNVKHIVTDFRQSGIEDNRVYNLAVKEKRLVVTFNDKHFKEFAPKNKNSGIIGVSTNLSNDQIDKKLTARLITSKSKDLYGKFTFISGETK